jgi:hypothetical protein
MAVSVPPEGSQVVCRLVGMDTDVEALVAHRGGVVIVEYSRPSASQQRRVYLVEEYSVDDPALALELSRLCSARSD